MNDLDFIKRRILQQYDELARIRRTEYSSLERFDEVYNSAMDVLEYLYQEYNKIVDPPKKPNRFIAWLRRLTSSPGE